MSNDSRDRNEAFKSEFRDGTVSQGAQKDWGNGL